ncbi:MAG: tRNA uridine-5-carboxymethylaminomethyl(34) synthesis GTPase MnmE [Bacteroidota bacterium]
MIELPNLKDTIVALSTPPGVGALGVIRLSGVHALTIANKIFNGKNLEIVPSHTIHYGTIRKKKKVIDEVLISVFRAPKSFTKEDVIEISCHGSPYILNEAIQLCIDHGARLAGPGEFSMRAFINGQMDLSRAEAIADLIAANSEQSHKLAMKQMRGGIANTIQQMRTELIDFASLMELELDFSEEDVEFANREQLKVLVLKLNEHIGQLIESFKYGNAIKNGIPTVIAGRPNAGKSTLLNALLNEERAIVSEIAGTTRDTIEEVLNIKGVEFRLIDTAGIRDAQDRIETIGVEKTFEKIAQSNILIYVFDIIETSVEEVQKDVATLNSNNFIVVANKMDLNPYTKPEDYYNETINESNFITASAINDMNVQYLKDVLFEKVIGAKQAAGNVILTNSRHLDIFEKTKASLDEVLEGLKTGIPSDLIAFNIRNALHHLGMITGEISTDDLLGNIFGKFCIGK